MVIILPNLYKKMSSSLLIFFIILSIITFAISYTINDSYASESQNTANKDFNIIATADIDVH